MLIKLEGKVSKLERVLFHNSFTWKTVSPNTVTLPLFDSFIRFLRIGMEIVKYCIRARFSYAKRQYRLCKISTREYYKPDVLNNKWKRLSKTMQDICFYF